MLRQKLIKQRNDLWPSRVFHQQHEATIFATGERFSNSLGGNDFSSDLHFHRTYIDIFS